MNIINMQQLKVEHENTTAKKDRRSGKGRCIALSGRIYRLMQTEDVFYVETESTDNVYYFVKFKPDVVESWYCSCRDNSTRGQKMQTFFCNRICYKMGNYQRH